MNPLRSLCVGAVVAASVPFAFSTAALAQETAPAKPEKPAPTLKVGMPAPEFKVEKFIKGKEFSGFEKEKVYVVEFWATWCGPCIMGMPHLSELSREYKDKGVTIVGVNVWEEREYNDKTLEKVAKFVEGKGDDMDYTVVYDGPTKTMDTAWMKAAGQNGIPAAFVVDQKGIVAWIGHPMNLDMVLDEVVAKKWDPATGEERMRAAEKAFEDAAKKFETGLADGNTAWDDAVKAYPIMGKKLNSQRFGAMLGAGHTKEAVELGNKLADEAMKSKKSGALMELLGAMSDPTSLKTPEAKALLLKVATANFDLSDKTQYGPHVTVARAYFIAGETEKGREASKKALELAPERLRPRIEAWLKEAETTAGAK